MKTPSKLLVSFFLAVFCLSAIGARADVENDTIERAAASSPVTVKTAKFQNDRKLSLELLEGQYERIWLLAQQNFLYEERLKNWDAWRQKYRGRLKSMVDVERACTTMLDSLMDEYTFFRDTHSTDERKQEAVSHNVVVSRTMRGDVGYIKIKTFSSRACVGETRAALKNMTSANSFVLDLRDNWGGSIDDAFAVFQMLVNEGVFVKMSGREDDRLYSEMLSLESNAAVRTKNGDACKQTRESCLIADAPLLVLVNSNTKSAAEMLAGALKDNCRAQLLGDRTFGKGVVQQVWEFDNGTSVKITSARFFLPSGAAVHGVGVAPDFKIARGNHSDNQLKRAAVIASSNGRRRMVRRSTHTAMRTSPPENRLSQRAGEASEL